MLRKPHEKEKVGELFRVIVVELIDNEVVAQRQDILEEWDAIISAVARVECVVKDVRVHDEQSGFFAAIGIQAARVLHDVVQRRAAPHICFAEVFLQFVAV